MELQMADFDLVALVRELTALFQHLVRGKASSACASKAS